MNALVFAGTTEGRSLALYLADCGVAVTACVATEYGGAAMPDKPGLTVRTGRLDAREMARMMGEYALVVDATHPFASAATGNIREACARAGREYIRLLRPQMDAGDAVRVGSAREAAAYLNETSGNALLTTGSKELQAFTAVEDYQTRLYARVLPSADMVRKCAELGFKGSNLICMQGPFSHELNLAMLRQIGARWLVTKESGLEGGLAQKLSAASAFGAGVILIGRPAAEQGLSYGEVLNLLKERFGIEKAPKNKRFPLFIDIAGKKAVVVGAGRIAARRVRVLLEYGADIRVVAPEFCEEIKRLAEAGRIMAARREYRQADLEGATLAVAATDRREVNRAAALDAGARGIPVSVADSRRESSFYFPAVFEGGGVAGGLVSADGADHAAAKERAAEIRGLLREAERQAGI